MKRPFSTLLIIAVSSSNSIGGNWFRWGLNLHLLVQRVSGFHHHHQIIRQRPRPRCLDPILTAQQQRLRQPNDVLSQTNINNNKKEEKRFLRLQYSKVETAEKANERSTDSRGLPYVIARGDGSTGGGGRPMPIPKQHVLQQTQQQQIRTELEYQSQQFKPANVDDGLGEQTSTSLPASISFETTTNTTLRRPHIGAEMPIGRPSWFRVPAPSLAHTSRYTEVKESLQHLKLHTVCEEAQCPNVGECWNGGTGTIMLLGDTCTRGCMFCAVNTASKPAPPDPFEPFHTAEAVAQWGVDYIVLTSVDRDDLEDGGAQHFAHTVELLKLKKPELLVECLVSDFQGRHKSVATLAQSGLDVYAHNVETVERLQRFVRDPRAHYQQSLSTLAYAKQVNPQLYIKTSLMLGLGETETEVIQTMKDLRAIDVDVVTFGQYLRPTERHLAVVEYVHPDTFARYKRIGEEELGFKYVASGPMVRSSYKAGEFFLTHMIQSERRKQ